MLLNKGEIAKENATVNYVYLYMIVVIHARSLCIANKVIGN